MTEAIETKEPVEMTETEAEKRYTFRKLSSDDMFLMFSIIKKIGLKEFKQCFDGESVKQIMAKFVKVPGNDENAEAPGNDGEKLLAVGLAVGFDALDVIIGNLPKCKDEIYQLLAQASNVSVKEIRGDGLLMTDMIIDFFKKPEFPAFFKAVSKLFR